ncbi:helix-turn-helix domain-containing protein [Halobacterium zhouii]|uniref:helix-turn-helix domain-containing protein n=1 Tax=Halobacterium zhouii TaxID=2902624 RepID=UPI001E458994|nr:helix-turn-helix domain-containing protein [Halobacterium zhouii]
MATEATFTVPASEFPLGTIFDELPDVTVELERVVPSTSTVVPYFWVRGVETGDIVEAFAEHPGVRNIQLVDSVANEHLLRAEWVPNHEGVLDVLAEAELAIIEVIGTDEQWSFQIRGDSRDHLARFSTRCEELDIPIQLSEVRALARIENNEKNEMTDAQREVLALAYERGYFNSPRDVTMAELGDELGISQQAVASRLRRATRRIVSDTLSALEA